jgi:hypothetical protein
MVGSVISAVSGSSQKADGNRIFKNQKRSQNGLTIA